MITTLNGFTIAGEVDEYGDLEWCEIKIDGQWLDLPEDQHDEALEALNAAADMARYDHETRRST